MAKPCPPAPVRELADRPRRTAIARERKRQFGSHRRRRQRRRSATPLPPGRRRRDRSASAPRLTQRAARPASSGADASASPRLALSSPSVGRAQTRATGGLRGSRRTSAADSPASSQRPSESSMRARCASRYQPPRVLAAFGAVLEPRLDIRFGQLEVPLPHATHDEQRVRTPDIVLQAMPASRAQAPARASPALQAGRRRAPPPPCS